MVDVAPKTMITILQAMASNLGLPLQDIGLIILLMACLLFLVINFEYGLIMTFFLLSVYLVLVLVVGLPSFITQIAFLTLLVLMILLIVMRPNAGVGVNSP